MLINNGIVLSRRQARAIDEAAVLQLGLSSLMLMENAARGACEVLEHKFRLQSATSVFGHWLEQKHRRPTHEHQTVLTEVLSATNVFDLESVVQTLAKAARPVSRATVSQTAHDMLEAGLLQAIAASSNSYKVTCPRALIVCGPGNNGGDGIALARHCHAVGMPVRLFMVKGGKNLSDDAESNLAFLKRCGLPFDEPQLDELVTQIQDAKASDIVVDCLLGTGVKGKPREPFLAIIDAINRSEAQVLSVDVPSGLDCDSGIAVDGCVRANHTVTFVGMKRGFQQPGANEFTGEVSVAHIGIPLIWIHRWLNELQEPEAD